MTSARIFQNRRIWRLTHDAFLAAAALVAEREAGSPPAAVIGIARGGVPFAESVAAQLGVPAYAFRARHNRSEEIQQAATGHVDLEVELSAATALAQLPQGSPLLVVDDICGSGATLRAVVAALAASLETTCVRTAVLCRNAGADYPLDSWGWDVADWVHFPWEPAPDTDGSQDFELLPPLSRLQTAPLPAPRA
ncbi:phosphoribosyltransferase [Streptomyces sp. NPDC087440]|uniref:phosphoribosyltransferase n=1 Tax=Streptomyces sp. NPDC087440 TaxID=3365790 RepID=UPI0038272D64